MIAEADVTKIGSLPPPGEEQSCDEHTEFIASLELHSKIRESPAVLEIAEEFRDRNYEDFISPLSAHKLDAPSACRSESNASPARKSRPRSDRGPSGSSSGR
jgi:hypothetical protein